MNCKGYLKPGRIIWVSINIVFQSRNKFFLIDKIQMHEEFRALPERKFRYILSQHRKGIHIEGMISDFFLDYLVIFLFEPFVFWKKAINYIGLYCLCKWS